MNYSSYKFSRSQEVRLILEDNQVRHMKLKTRWDYELQLQRHTITIAKSRNGCSKLILLHIFGTTQSMSVAIPACVRYTKPHHR